MNSNDYQDQKRIYKDKTIIKRLFTYIKGHERSFIFALIFMVLMAASEITFPLISGWAVNVLEDKSAEYQELIYIVATLLFVITVNAISQYYRGILLQKAGQRILYELREQIFTHIESLSIDQINHTPIGKLVTRVTNDTNTLNDLFTNIIVNVLKNILTIVGVIIMMFVVNWRLALITISVTPVVGLLSYIFRKTSRKVHREVRSSISNLNAFLSENLSGMKITQVFNQETKKLNEFKGLNQKWKEHSLKELLVFGIFRPTIYVLYLLTSIGVLYFSSLFVMRSNYLIDTAVVFIFYSYVSDLFNPIQQLAEQFNVIQSAFASSERIFEILDTIPAIQDEEDAIELTEVKGEIEFDHVWFCYNPDEWVLRDVSFKVKANETVAFVGATGSGKTTIMSLIVRNYDIQKGRILIDGIDIKKIKLSSLRSKIGQMLQDVFLFSGTITSNIAMRDDNITAEQVKEACQYVNASHFIEKLPNQYEEEVRERGNNFSSGQRQLLSFARTIAHKPNILILDEATANIDTETEVLIQDSLEKMMNIGTMLIVAHRLSTIQHADKIIVLRKGKIIEMGTHRELIASGGHYQNLYQLQYQNNIKTR